MNLKALETLKLLHNIMGSDSLLGKDLKDSITELKGLENRSCENCKYFVQSNFYGVCRQDVNTTKNQDEFLSNIEFCCNRWKENDS